MITLKISLLQVIKMKYMGSKSRIAKDIVPIIQSKIKENDIITYIEPFCGGCNVIDKIQCETKIVSDNNPYLIELFKNKDNLNELPDIVTKELYSDCRKAYYSNDFSIYPQYYIAAIGFLQVTLDGFMMVDLMDKVSLREEVKETIMTKQKETLRSK